MKNFLRLDFDYAAPLSIKEQKNAAKEAQDRLEEGSGPGADFLGWRDLPKSISPEQYSQIEESARLIQKAEALVIIGIGGSFLGAKAVLEGLRFSFARPELPIYFAGWQMDGSYHQQLLNVLKEKRYAVNVISKSGATIEPALAFRFFWEDLSRRFSERDLQDLVFPVTDAKKGSLKKLAEKYDLTCFTIPDNVGGRYSVFTSVGLLPLAASGINIRKLIEGAAAMRASLQTKDFDENPALQYAAYRNAAYQSGKKIEILAVYQQNLQSVAEWWKQLFGESEGKQGRGIYPTAARLTTDLHSLGQWIQEGERSIFETVLEVEKVDGARIPALREGIENIDGFGYLSGKNLHAVNLSAAQASLMAHQAGGVPCLRIRIPEINENTLGGLLYFFEYACAVSAYMLGVNPFDQPGVEAYKQNMFRLLASSQH